MKLLILNEPDKPTSVPLFPHVPYQMMNLKKRARVFTRARS